eukprot:2206810-Amphidinium_carterae.1
MTQCRATKAAAGWQIVLSAASQPTRRFFWQCDASPDGGCGTTLVSNSDDTASLQSLLTPHQGNEARHTRCDYNHTNYSGTKKDEAVMRLRKGGQKG